MVKKKPRWCSCEENVIRGLNRWANRLRSSLSTIQPPASANVSNPTSLSGLEFLLSTSGSTRWMKTWFELCPHARPSSPVHHASCYTLLPVIPLNPLCLWELSHQTCCILISFCVSTDKDTASINKVGHSLYCKSFSFIRVRSFVIKKEDWCSSIWNPIHQSKASSMLHKKCCSNCHLHSTFFK